MYKFYIENSSVTHAEFRRQIHIQSEQRRRAEIKDGFEELRRQLPISNNGRKMSKALLLQKSEFSRLPYIIHPYIFLFDGHNSVRFNNKFCVSLKLITRKTRFNLCSYY